MASSTSQPPARSSSPALELRGLRKSYRDKVAVDGVSCTVPNGTVFGLLGPNGAGKTTTLRMVMDIIAPDEGEILLFGRQRRRQDLERIGYLPEERGLYRKMKVLEHLVFLGELNGVARGTAAERSRRWLERLELGDTADQKVEELSKGMQQKVQIAGTLLHEPDVVILDEPFSGLDPINQVLFKDVLAEYKAEGKTIVFSTHVMEQAEKLCDDICLISDGRAVLQGGLREIRRRMGDNSFRLVAEGDLNRIASVPGVERWVASDREAGVGRVLLAGDADGARILRELVAFLEVREFLSEEPELEEVFVRAVNDSRRPAAAAGPTSRAGRGEGAA